MTRTLDKATLAELRRPFTIHAVRFKPQTVTKDQKKAMAAHYIDARLVAERLNAVVGADGWRDTYRVLFEDQAQWHAAFHFPVECCLTVLDVTRVDVGNYQGAAPDEKAVKSAYSDALKRAAVKFGIGAYLYSLPRTWAETRVGQNGKAQGYTPAGEAAIRRAYTQWLAGSLNTWGAPLDHGDVGEDPDASPETPPATAESGSDPPGAPALTPPAGGRENASAAPTVEQTEQILAVMAEINQLKPNGRWEEKIAERCEADYGTPNWLDLDPERAAEFVVKLKALRATVRQKAGAAA